MNITLTYMFRCSLLATHAILDAIKTIFSDTSNLGLSLKDNSILSDFSWKYRNGQKPNLIYDPLTSNDLRLTCLTNMVIWILFKQIVEQLFWYKPAISDSQIVCVIEKSSCGAVNQWTKRRFVKKSSQDPNYLNSITIYLFQI